MYHGLPVTFSSTTGTLVMGANLIGSTTGALHYSLPTPVPGSRVSIFHTGAASTTGIINVIRSGSTGITFDGTNDRIRVDAGGLAAGISIELVATSATRWGIMSIYPDPSTGKVTLGTT